MSASISRYWVIQFLANSYSYHKNESLKYKIASILFDNRQ